MRPQKDRTDMSSAIDKHLVMTTWIWVALGDCAYRASAVANALANGRPRQECYPVPKNLGATLRAQVSADLKKHKNFRAGWVPDERWTADLVLNSSADCQSGLRTIFHSSSFWLAVKVLRESKDGRRTQKEITRPREERRRTRKQPILLLDQ